MFKSVVVFSAPTHRTLEYCRDLYARLNDDEVPASKKPTEAEFAAELALVTVQVKLDMFMSTRQHYTTRSSTTRI